MQHLGWIKNPIGLDINILEENILNNYYFGIIE